MNPSEPEPLGSPPAVLGAAPAARPGAGAILGALALLTFGIWFFVHYQAVERQKVGDNLESISRLKAGQIAQWRRERLSDAEDLASSAFLIAAVDRWLAQPQADEREKIMGRLRGLQKRGKFYDVWFLDSAGQFRLSASGHGRSPGAADQAALKTVLQDRRPLLTDLHVGGDSAEPHIDAVAPLVTRDGRTLGAIFLQSSATDFLFPMIQHWPTPSASAETALIRRDGDDVLFLNALRHRNDSALSLRLPLGRSDLPAVQAVRGRSGVFEGRDHRGTPVLSVLRPIADSPWFLVTKMDTAEAYADWHERAALMLGMMAALALTAMVFILWQRQRLAHYRVLQAAQEHIGRDHEHQAAQRRLLEIVLRDTGLETSLGECLDLLLALPWLSVLPNGGIHLMASDGRSLELAVARNMAPDRQAQCARLPVGHCLCGRAAASGEVLFAPHLDARHDIQLPDREDCAHWCLPLRTHGQVLGVLVLHMRAGSPRDPHQEAFLGAAADILATFIERKRMEEVLHRFALVLEQTTSAVCITNERAEIEFVNAAFTRMTGYGADELIGRNPRLLRSGETPTATFADLWSTLSAGASWHGEVINRRKDGSSFVVSQVVTPIRQSGGRLSHYAAISEDVTEKQRDAAALARYRNQLEDMVEERTSEIEEAHRRMVAQEHFIRTVTDNIPDLVSYWDAGLHCRFANAPFLAWFGKKPTEMLGIHLHELAGEALFRQNEPHIRAALRGERQMFDISLARADGSTGHILAHYLPDLADGVVRGFYATVQDVTAHKQAEMDSQRALDEAQRLARLKSDFLANMSHEIRTPLNAVLGLAQTGMRDNGGRKAQASFQRILASGRHLLEVVNEILDFSKIEAGKMVVVQAPFVLGAAIDDAIGLTATAAYAKGLDVRVAEAADLPERIIGDAMRLTQVLVNLLANAVKFTERGRVELAVARDGDTLVFRVSDSGIGIPPEQLGRLFQAFEQGDNSATRHFAGTGLGLAISKRLVEAMGGTLEVDSVPGAGTRFELRLPVPDLDSAPRLQLARRAARIRLVGLATEDCALLAADLGDHGIHAETVAEADAFGTPLPDRIVVALDVLLSQRLVVPASVQLVVVAPAGCPAEPDALPGTAIVVERPLRVRRICADACTRQDAGGHAGNRLAGLRILAAEDMELNRIVLEDILAHEGAQVRFAADGREAVDLLHERGRAAFDLALMDIQMPHMDGIEATRLIHELAPGLPVIGLTAHAMAEERQRCFEAGMVAHVTKPIDIEVLVATIREHVAARPALPLLPLLSLLSPAPVAACAAATAEVADLVAAPVVDPVDWAALSQRFNGRHGFVNKLLGTVRTNQREVPAKLRDAARRQDGAAIRFIAHAVKGVGGNLMAARLHTLACRAESSAHAGRADAPALAQALARATEELLAVIDARLGQDATDGER